MAEQDTNGLIAATSLRRDVLGGVSDMTLWRWLDNPDLGFPKPIYIARRRYWRKADVLAWLEAQAETQK